MQGTIANITFRRTQDGFIAGLRSDLNKERIKSDPSFVRTRENDTEFQNAAKAAEALRNVFTLPILDCHDNRVQSRLVRRTMQVVKSDTTSERGKRNMADGDETLLNLFPWNKYASYTRIMKAPFTISVDRIAGTVTVDIPPFVPDEQLVVNYDATHFKLIASAAEMDWAIANNPDAQMEITAALPVGSTATTAISAALSLTAGTTLPIFVTLSIKWYQQVGGNFYVLKNQDFDGSSIELVDVV